MAPYPVARVSAVVLAGGRARRMRGADKGLLEVAGKPMIEHVVERLRGQASEIIVSTNRHPDRYAEYGRVTADEHADFRGPLAGIAAALTVAAGDLLLVVPCDAPELPVQLGPRLHEAMSESAAAVAVAHDGNRLQPVFLLLAVSLGRSLDDFLAGGGRKVDQWLAAENAATAPFDDLAASFVNVNTREDLEAARANPDRARSGD